MIHNYTLLDCGDKQKLEQIGQYKIIRPCPQALWPKLNPEAWTKGIDAEFVRTTEEKGTWNWTIPVDRIPENWKVKSPNGLIWNIEPNDFGNIGIFAEHWGYAEEISEEFKPNCGVLNLFTYFGSNAVRLVQKGFSLTAVDSSKLAMTNYVGNLENNHLDRTGQRLIKEDAYTFVQREVRRGAKYEAIMADAPSYGKGTKQNQMFKIEDDLIALMIDCEKLLTEDGKMIFTLHSPRFTPAGLEILSAQLFPNRKTSCREIFMEAASGVRLPSGFLVKIY